jgi:hypothetical protein
VPPEHEISAHYFLSSGGTGVVSIRSVSEQVTLNMCFCIRREILVTYYIPVHPGRETPMHYFSCSCGTGMDSTKSALRDVTPNLFFASSRICGSRSALRCIRRVKC